MSPAAIFPSGRGESAPAASHYSLELGPVSHPVSECQGGSEARLLQGDAGDGAAHARTGRREAHHARAGSRLRSEEHTSELQSHHDIVCRLLLEKKKKVACH